MNTSSWYAGDRPADGSSSSSTDGSIISARPMATIWRSPPDSDPARCLRRSPSSGNSSHDLLEALAERPAGCWYSPISRFSSTVRRGNTLLFWGT